MASYKRIIFNADDFGYRKEINKGIIYAHKNGLVKNTTVLTDREAFEDAVALAKENPDLKTGLHIDLDPFFKILRPEGKIENTPLNHDRLREITDSIERQIDKFLNAGLKLSHLDSHHHAHMHIQVLPIVASKAKELGLPMRFFRSYYNDEKQADEMKQIVDNLGIKYCPHFINGWYWKNVDEDFQLAELMVHPGFNDAWREFELERCCDPKLIRYLKEANIEVISFNEI